MKKTDFINRHSGLQVSQSELERKWRIMQEQQENDNLLEALHYQNNIAMANGTVNPSINLFMEDDYIDDYLL
jgi:hypothetical protein